MFSFRHMLSFSLSHTHIYTFLLMFDQNTDWAGLSPFLPAGIAARKSFSTIGRQFILTRIITLEVKYSQTLMDQFSSLNVPAGKYSLPVCPTCFLAAVIQSDLAGFFSRAILFQSLKYLLQSHKPHAYMNLLKDCVCVRERGCWWPTAFSLLVNISVFWECSVFLHSLATCCSLLPHPHLPEQHWPLGTTTRKVSKTAVLFCFVLFVCDVVLKS